MQTQRTGFLGSWLSWDLTVLSCWIRQKKPHRDLAVFFCFFWCRSLSSVTFASLGSVRGCFSYLSVLYGSSDLHWCCVVQLVIGERRKLLASFSFRKLSVWVISQFLLRSWSSNVLWFHAFHRDDVVWFPFFFTSFLSFFLYMFSNYMSNKLLNTSSGSRNDCGDESWTFPF